MAFKYSERHYEEFWRDGCTILRGVVPPALIRELRKTTDRLRELARLEFGPQANRTSTLGKYDLGMREFRNYFELPALTDVFARILTPEHRIGDLDDTFVLLEPRDFPYAQEWHRDWRDLVPADAWEREFRQQWTADIRSVHRFNQINCALYEDCSLWFVPGTAYVADNLSEFVAAKCAGVNNEIHDNRGGRSYEEQERYCLEYCRQMPGGQSILLHPGDAALYRQTGWHLGNYSPHRKRATIHHHPYSPEAKKRAGEWVQKVRRARESHALPPVM